MVKHSETGQTKSATEDRYRGLRIPMLGSRRNNLSDMNVSPYHHFLGHHLLGVSDRSTGRVRR